MWKGKRMKKLKSNQLLDELLQVTRAYATTRRSMITQERWEELVVSGRITDYTLDSEFLREPLLEHVGHLPVIAVALYPHIHQTAKVDLGKVLQMLALHDIGETVIGDIHAYKKTQDHADKELAIARKLVPPSLLPIFEEYEDRQTIDAKFAKAVDSIAPFLHELSAPALTAQRFKHHQFGSKQIRAIKQQHFAFDPVLVDLFEECMRRFEEIEKIAS